MPDTGPPYILLLPMALWGFLMWGWWVAIRFKRTVENVPTSKVNGVFIGLNEVKGVAESESPLTTYLTETPAVWYEWKVQEKWRRTETYRDSKGRRRTRTRTGWSTVDSGDGSQPFHLRDETGSLLVRPQGADMEVEETLSRHCSGSDPMYYGKGPERAISNSTHQRHFVEHALRPGDATYILGPARLREDAAAPVLEHDEDERYFFITTKSEQQVTQGRGILATFLLSLAFIAAIAVPLLLYGSEEGLRPMETVSRHPSSLILATAVFGTVWAGLYTLLLYNGLIRVRNRMERALSLIDIQLKRRHDLIPRLVECVQGASQHERQVQEAITEARNQFANWQGEQQDRATSLTQDQPVLNRLIAVHEAYPELRTDTNYREFFDELTDTENRIALARTYYNDSLLALKNRLTTFPDLIIARLFRFQPGNALPSPPPEAKAPPVITSQDLND